MLNDILHYQPRMPFNYPADNHTEFERWYFDNADISKGNRVYLPIMWTAYYVRNSLNRDTHKFHSFAFNNLQDYLNTLPRDVKYYTVVQHDDGILHDLSHLDIKVFSTGGGNYDHAIPLVSWPHEWEFRGVKKSILASFVGQITHPIRQRIIDKYGLRNDALMLSIKKMPLKEYCHILAMSKYVLCPRGYGPTSFRIQEAMQYGAIPVYISDTFVEPSDTPFMDYGYMIHPSEMDNYDFTNLPVDPYFDTTHSKHYHKSIFTYDACKRYIESKISS